MCSYCYYYYRRALGGVAPDSYIVFRTDSTNVPVQYNAQQSDDALDGKLDIRVLLAVD